VLIPEANVQHLMLREDVVEAATARRFHIYPIRTVDEAVTLLTGIEAGMRGDNGHYPNDSVNGRVTARLQQLAELRRAFSEHRDGGEDSASG
jgi:predicted ATP-dependent protease